MQREAFIMKLKPGCAAEYKRRHDEIWPELVAELTAAGIRDYSIYLDDETETLFAFRKLKSGHTADELPNQDVVKRWCEYMADVVEFDSEGQLVSRTLKEMFHMD